MKRQLLSLIALGLLSACSPNLSTNDRAILGGKTVSADSLIAKSTVAVGLFDDGSFSDFCTGTIISKNLILTAAHCIASFDKDSHDLVIYFGNDLQKYDASLARKVIDFEYHPNFQEQYDSNSEFITSLNDVALLKIENDIPTSSQAVSIIEENLKLPNETNLTLAGWGYLDNDFTYDAESLQQTEVTLKKYWATHLITNQTQGKGACAGDSGGPAYIEQDNQLIVVGATRGPHMPTFTCSVYGEFSSLTIHKNFIITSAQKMSAELPVFSNILNAEIQVFDTTPPTDYDRELSDEAFQIMEEIETREEDERLKRIYDPSETDEILLSEQHISVSAR